MVVSAPPVEYGTITVTNKRTGLEETILDTDNEPLDEGDVLMSYAFKAGERVRRPSGRARLPRRVPAARRARRRDLPGVDGRRRPPPT